MITKVNKNAPLFFLISLCVILAIYSFDKKKEYNSLQELFYQDKIILQEELDNAIENYNELSTRNKTLSRRVIANFNKIIALKDSVKNLNENNYESLIKYRNNFFVLREENRTLRIQVNSLKNDISVLKLDNSKVSDDLEEKVEVVSVLQENNNKLQKTNEVLNAKMSLAKRIKTSTVYAMAMKEKTSGRLSTTTKSNKADVFKVSFKLLANTLTNPGLKKIHIQIQNEQGVVVAPRTSVVLNNKNKIQVSDELTVEYYNEDAEILSLILTENLNLTKGNYKVNVFVEGCFTSSSIIRLK